MRIKQRDKILKITELLELDRNCTELLLWLYDNQEDGLINFEARKVELMAQNGVSINDLYFNCKKLIDEGYIKVCNHNLQILVCSETYMTNLLHKTLKKRSYSKNPILEQENFSSLFDQSLKAMYQFIASKVQKPEDLSIPKSVKISIQGVKIPVAFRAYLMSEQLKEDELNGGIPTNFKYFYYEDNAQKEYVAILEEQRRNLSKEEKRVLVALLFMCKCGAIKHFSVNALVETLNNTFDKGFSKTTVNDAIKTLQRLWFISIVDGELKIRHYEESFGLGKNYIVVPICVLKRAFKKLHVGAIKAFFHFIFLLNNGENSKGQADQGQEKSVYFKIGSLSTETDEQKKKYENNKRWMRRRSPKEIMDIILGVSEGKSTPLGEFFDFHLLENGTALQVRISKQYYIKKKTVIEALEIDPILRYPRKAKVIQAVLQETKFTVGETDLKSLIKIFQEAERKTIKVILEYTVDRMQKVKIENIGGYIATLYKYYKTGKFRKKGEYAF